LAKVWTFWIAVALVIPAIMLAVGIVIGYLYKVVMPRYPKR
jgi:uncharacterized protein (UPF0333 family)